MDGVSLEALEHARNMTCQENKISPDTAQGRVAETSPRVCHEDSTARAVGQGLPHKMFTVVAGGDDASQESVADGFDGPWQAASSEQHNGKLKKASELLGRLREAFPMFDDNILAEHLRMASSDFQRTTKSLSKLGKSKGVSLVPADIPR